MIHSNVPLSQSVGIRAGFSRSINLARDRDSNRVGQQRQTVVA